MEELNKRTEELQREAVREYEDSHKNSSENQRKLNLLKK